MSGDTSYCTTLLHTKSGFNSSLEKERAVSSNAEEEWKRAYYVRPLNECLSTLAGTLPVWPQDPPCFKKKKPGPMYHSRGRSNSHIPYT